jgi:Zn-dependent protease with chaperone function
MSLEAHEDHGHTPAAWTTVIVVFLGACVSGAAVIVAMIWLFFVGIGVMVVGVIVGKVMQMMGLGAHPAVQPNPPALRRETAKADEVHDVHAQGPAD